MENENTFFSSPKIAYGLTPEPDESSLHPPICFSIYFNIIRLWTNSFSKCPHPISVSDKNYS